MSQGAHPGLTHDGWLSEVLGRPAFRVDQALDAARIAGHIREQAHAFYSAKVPSTGLQSVSLLEGLGFRVVDVNVVFDRGLANPPSQHGRDGKDGSVDVSLATPADAEPAAEIGGTAFRYSRFHLDPHFPRHVADTIKREWVRNAARGARGDAVWIARRAGAVEGFLISVLADQGKTAVIDLIGVGVSAQNSGVGGALVAAFLERYADRCTRAAVGTQIANIPSCRFYEKLGFRLSSSQYVLHLHVEGGKPAS